MKITMIPADCEGKRLRELKKRGRYLRCDGVADDRQINEALEHVARGRLFGGLGEAWARIFGRDQ